MDMNGYELTLAIFESLEQRLSSLERHQYACADGCCGSDEGRPTRKLLEKLREIVLED